MGAAQKDWARRARIKLKTELGDKCAKCGATEPDVELEFDCVKACGDKHHKMDTSHRMSFYRAQHRIQNLQILCKKCNTVKSAGELPFEYGHFAAPDPDWEV